MGQIRETLEFFDEFTGKVVKKKSHKIPMEYPSHTTEETFFPLVVQGFFKKRESFALRSLNTVEKEKINDKKYVIIVKPCLMFEYAQRWTYELL